MRMGLGWKAGTAAFAAIAGVAGIVGMSVASGGDRAPAIDFSAARAGQYESDPGHSYIYFSYFHAGYSKPIIRWRDWKGTLDWNPGDPAQSELIVVINVAGVDTGLDLFDGHLTGADYFDAEQFPTITFKSTKLEQTGPQTGVLTGDLTIKGVTRPLSLDVTLNKAAKDDFFKAYKLGFSARGQLKRSDFGLGAYVPVVSDEVDLVIETEFNLPLEG